MAGVWLQAAVADHSSLEQRLRPRGLLPRGFVTPLQHWRPGQRGEIGKDEVEDEEKVKRRG